LAASEPPAEILSVSEGPRVADHSRQCMEARGRIELPYKGFADPLLPPLTATDSIGLLQEHRILSPFCPPHQQSQPKTVDLKGATRNRKPGRYVVRKCPALQSSAGAWYQRTLQALISYGSALTGPFLIETRWRQDLHPRRKRNAYPSL